MLKNMSNLINHKGVEFELNLERFNYILDLFGLTKEEFISRLNEGRKREVLNLNELNDILNKKAKIKFSVLNKIDKLFEKGVTWYISKRELPEREGSSIFFRKNKFNISSKLNLDTIKLTNKFEERNFEIQTLCKFIDFDAKRKLNKYTTNDNPEKVAVQLLEDFQKIENDLLSKKIIKKVKDNDKEALKNLIHIIEEFNIFVFEFVENWNKKEKADFDGFFVKPNMIVIKRQKYFRREIFTLLHEFAHYLLDNEEIDKVHEDILVNRNGKIERWCNTFTYTFLIGDYGREIEGLDYACEENNFYEDEVNSIYKNTLLSKSAIYTGLRIRNKISQEDYTKKIKSINDSINRELDKKRFEGVEKREALKKQGIKPKGGSQKPIQSNLFKEIVKINYFQGNIDENSLCDFLKIKPDRIGREIY